MSSGSNSADFTNDEAAAFKAAATLAIRPGDRAKSPMVYFVVGQQGSGKSTAIHHILKSLPPGEAASVLDGDFITSKHPSFRETARTQGVTAAENEAKHFTRKCFGEIATGAVRARAHLIIEAADPGTGIEPIVSSFRAQGYKSQLIALSVPDFVSRQALAIREKVEKERLGYARIVPRSAHDKAYAQWPGRIAGLLEAKLFDSVKIIAPRRGADAGKSPSILSISDKSVMLQMPMYTHQGLKPLLALIDHRSTSLTEMDRRAHDNRWRELATSNPEGSAIYEHERHNQSGIMRLSRHERFTREIHLAINGAQGLPVQVMPEGAMESLQKLAVPPKRIGKSSRPALELPSTAANDAARMRRPVPLRQVSRGGASIEF